MSLCRRPYIDNIKEFSQGEKDRLTIIDNEIWEQAKESKLFLKVTPKVGNPAYQIKNNASLNNIYIFINDLNKKYNKKIVSLVKKTGFNREVLSVNVIPLNKETQGKLFSENIEEKKDLKDLGLEQRLFSGSKTTTSLEILNKIANSDHNLALLAAHLIPYAKYNNVKINLVENIEPSTKVKNPIGTYNTRTNEIKIKRTANFKSGRAEATILHEIIHSLTANELEISTEANTYFNELYNHASLYLDTLNLYGLSNTDEFITALFTDADFITKLQNVPPLNKKKYTNLFQEVFDKILKLLRITKSSSFYDEAFSTATNIIENFRQREIEKAKQQEEYAKEYEEYLKSPAYQKQLFSEEKPNIKPGVEEIFNDNPELSSIGTPEQYSQYLDSIFPDSKVKDIVYHSGSINKNDKFDRNKIGVYSNLDLFYFSSSETFREIKTKLDLFKHELQKNLFHKEKKLINKANSIDEAIEIYKKSDSVNNSPNKKSKISNISFLLDNLDELFKTRKDKIVGGWYDGTWSKGKLKAFILDIKNPYDGVKGGVSKENLNKVEGKGVLSKRILNEEYDSQYNPVAPKDIGVKNPEQIHILGSKQDIEGFKEFVGESTQTVESYRAQEQAELSQRIPNIENYKVNGKVVKSLITDENDLKNYNEIYDKYDALITPLLETSEEGTNTVKNKIAINKLFKSLPILGTIGTEEQYLRHFNSVYSDTSVPIVVYRAVKHEGFELKDKSFFTDDPEYAIKYGNFLKPYKLNILNPYTSTKVGIHRASIVSMLENPMIDGIIGKESLNNVTMGAVAIELQEAQAEGRFLSLDGAIKRLSGPLTDVNSFVTTNKNQIYELGTDTDIDNFKNFVQDDIGPKELNKKSVSLYSKIFDISEDEINDHLKNCS